jgi:two-component system sensor histidine kinase RpfC
MLKSIRRWIAARLGARPDKEHEITLNRLVIALVVLAYLFLVVPADPSLRAAQALGSGFTVGALLLALHLLARPGISVPRRLCGMLLDLGVLTAGMAVAAPVIAALYPFYLWVILGYGFRYGLRYLFTAAILSILMFGAIVHGTEYWAANYPLGIGLLAGLVILPLYAASLVRKLSRARDQAEKANQAKSLFLASVSHELRTPLNAVTGMSDLLRNTALAPDQTDMVRTIHASAGRLISLIDDLLDFSRIDAGHIQFEPIVLDPVSVMRDTLRLVAPQAQEKGLRLHLHVTPRTPRAVLADRRRLSEITLNLLSNAVKFTSKGCVSLAIDLEGQGDEAMLRFEVDDTGIGIDPAAHGRIFETFTQANSTIANDFGGTGLGLAISRRLVQLQGGDIGVRSRRGQGSTFWFTLPAKLGPIAASQHGPPVYRVVLQTMNPAVEARMREAVEACGRSAEDGSATFGESSLPEGAAGRILILPIASRPNSRLAVLTEATQGITLLVMRSQTESGIPASIQRRETFAVLSLEHLQRDLRATFSAVETVLQPANDDEVQPIRRRAQGRRILLVDDNRVNRMVISRLLEAGGHHVTQASQGEEALDLLEQAEFDLVAMDLNMPVMDGIEATKIYRMASLDRPHLPIIALTADATEYGRQRSLEAGMDAYVTKPVNAAALLDLIDRLLDGKPLAASSARDLPKAPEPAAVQPSSILHLKMLEDLALLGGKEFVGEVIATFITDSANHLRNLEQQAAQVDAAAFRDSLHALRSCASNVGAAALSGRCGTWHGISQDRLRQDGPQIMRQLTEELEAAKAALVRWQAPPPVLVSRND